MKKYILLITLLYCFTLLHAQDSAHYAATQPIQIFKVVEQMPEFPGGTEALMKFIQNNVRYPDDARDIGVQGRVVVGFVVMQDGSIDSIVIKKSVWPSLDAEALRVARLLPAFKPGKQQGKAVRVQFLLPISMRLSGGDLDPLSNPHASNTEQKAVTAYEKANYTLALNLFKEIHQREPTNSFTAHNLGLCLYQTGDKDGACILWRQLGDKGCHTADYLIPKYCTNR